MKRKEISKIVLKVSEGVFSSLVDLVLWNAFYLSEVGFASGSPARLGRAPFSASKNLKKFNYLTIKRAMYNAEHKGWIKNDLTLTKEGRKRLQGFLPEYFEKRKWDGNWYLVSYDIPEEKKRFREILRENLKRLGFGKLHASLWISPFNFLEEAEEIVEEYNLSIYVILAVSDKVGREESRILANKIWNLKEINNHYQELIKKAQKKKPEKMIFEYMSILSRDPQLPVELLPEDWQGEEAYLFFKKYLYK
ncbi:hypothetical protein KAS79_02520 [Candidatus Parcubacteria bacterium]|nr:hypothetical protein [Candidatus Parcubacteria bacterium]